MRHSRATKRLKKEIRQAIENLHTKASGDYQTLLRQVKTQHKALTFNLPQTVAFMSKARTKVLEWGRGTGKTTYRGAHWTGILTEMPRSTGVVPAITYKDMLAHIVPSLIQGLEMFGLYQGLHYFIGERPPRSWRTTWGTAYQPPKKFDHYITFWNGTGAHLLSQDIAGDGRGLNADWLDADEVAKLDGIRLQQDVEPTLRGTNLAAFSKSRYFGSRLLSTSVALTPEGTWYQAYEEQALLHPKEVFFIKATAEHNAQNLRQGYLEEAQRTAISQWIYDAEYRNLRPKIVKDGFYSLLDPDVHGYFDYNYSVLTNTPKAQTANCTADNDLVAGVPLILGVDFGATINSLSVSQHLKSIGEYRTIKSFFVLGAEQKIQDDLFTAFHNYYAPHQASGNTIYLWYDATGNNATGHTRVTRAQQAREQLTRLGWQVQLMTLGGSNPRHEAKYRLWEMVLSEKNTTLPRYRINRGNARELWISMKNAKVQKSSTGAIQKNKASERQIKVPRQEATDLSDANDSSFFGMFSPLLAQYGAALPNDRVSTA